VIEPVIKPVGESAVSLPVGVRLLAVALQHIQNRISGAEHTLALGKVVTLVKGVREDVT
tara:strand:+ start:871 stop:1047 length:177 start_codon:yes stop_codon:yes gene_type:complete